MIYILSWTTKKHQNTLSRPLHSKLKKIQRTLKGLAQKFTNFSRKIVIQGFPLKIQDFSRLCEPWSSKCFQHDCRVRGRPSNGTGEVGARELEGDARGRMCNKSRIAGCKKHSLANFGRNFSKNVQNKRTKMKTQA